MTAGSALTLDPEQRKRRTFSVTSKPAWMVCPANHNYVVMAGSGALLQRRPGGQTFYLTYITEQRALKAAAEAQRAGFRNAHVEAVKR